MGSLINFPLWSGAPGECSAGAVRVALRWALRQRGAALIKALELGQRPDVRAFRDMVAVVEQYGEIATSFERWLCAAGSPSEDMISMRRIPEDDAPTLTPPFAGAVLCAKVALTLGGTRYHRGCAVPHEVIVSARNSAMLLKSCEWRQPDKASAAEPTVLPPPQPAKPLPLLIVMFAPSGDAVESLQMTVRPLLDAGVPYPVVEDLLYADRQGSDLLAKARQRGAYLTGWPNHRRVPPTLAELCPRTA